LGLRRRDAAIAAANSPPTPLEVIGAQVGGRRKGRGRQGCQDLQTHRGSAMGDQDADAELVERLIAGNVADVKGLLTLWCASRRPANRRQPIA
jgi:hypothetical protein